MIVAALSIQDPRERPADRQEQADELHRRFADKGSDFLTWLNLWRYLHERQAELSSNQFRKLCRAELLNYLRVREWQDLHGQLRAVARDLGIKLNRAEAEPDADRVHRPAGRAAQPHRAQAGRHPRVPGGAGDPVRHLPGSGWPGSRHSG